MTDDLRLIEILADGDFHSGEEVGRTLSISRAAVWKQLKKLEAEFGLRVCSIKGKGYRLDERIELLNRQLIIDSLQSSSLDVVCVRGRVGSTNQIGLELAQQRNINRGVIIAEQQFSGRGRRGRQWVSPFARNIYFSILWRFDVGASGLDGLSLAIGVAVATVLKKNGLDDVGLKWPNDIVFQGKKLAGVLLELTGDISDRCYVVVGVGVNVRMADAAEAKSIDQPWTDICSALGGFISRNKLVIDLVQELVKVLGEFELSGFSEFYKRWCELDCVHGKAVRVHVGERLVEGIAAGINAAGALAIDTEVGRQYFHGGEISLRYEN